MSVSISLTVTQGMLRDHEWALEGPARFVVGRAEDCDVRLPADRLHQDVSRRHFAIEIDADGCWVLDLGSRNGTFVNGVNVGRRTGGHDSGEAGFDGLAHHLKDGDEIRAGFTVFRVGLAVVAEEAVAGRLASPVG